MQLEARKYRYDIKRAADLVTEFTAGKGFGDYATDAMLRRCCAPQWSANSRSAEAAQSEGRPGHRL
jgi:hypothetical protein